MAGRFVDFYALLDVASDASFDAVRSAVVQQRRACEQRRASGDPADLAAAEDRIRDLDLAELVLLDPEQRADYDEEWRDRRNGHAAGEASGAPSAANGTHPAAHGPAEANGHAEPPADGSTVHPVADPTDAPEATHQPPLAPAPEGPGGPDDPAGTHQAAPAAEPAHAGDPTADAPAAGQHSADAAPAAGHSTEAPAAWQPLADMPAAGQHSADAPAAGQQPPDTEQPAAGQSTEAPSAWQPHADMPAAGQHSADAPAAGQQPPDTEQPGAGQSTEAPVAWQPLADIPAGAGPAHAGGPAPAAGPHSAEAAPAAGPHSADAAPAAAEAAVAGRQVAPWVGQQAPPDTREPVAWQSPSDTSLGPHPAPHPRPQPLPEVVEDEDGWVAQARDAVRAGDTALAVDSYHYAIMLHPHQIVLHYELGQAYVLAENYEQALGAFETATRLAPQVTDYRAAVGNALVHLARPGEAIAVLEQVVAEAPTEPRYRAELAQALHDTCVHEMTPLTTGMVCITTAEQAQVVERLTGRALTLLDPADHTQLAEDIREKHQLAKLAGKRVWRPPLPWWLMISFTAVITLGFALFLVWWAAPIALVVLGGVAFLLGLQPTYWHVAREARDAQLLA